MADMLSSSLLWRALLAIGGWFSAMVHSSKVFAWLGRTWHTSRTRAWLLRRLSASDAPTRDSRSAKRFARLNARLAARHGLRICTLGPRILRCETAPLCALTAVLFSAGALD